MIFDTAHGHSHAHNHSHSHAHSHNPSSDASGRGGHQVRSRWREALSGWSTYVGLHIVTLIFLCSQRTAYGRLIQSHCADDTCTAGLSAVAFTAAIALTLALFFSVALTPPKAPEHEDDSAQLTDESAVRDAPFCSECQHYRPPLAKHCHVCRRCVVRFDHHCPFTAQCIGAGNHHLFLAFVTSSAIEITVALLYTADSMHVGMTTLDFITAIVVLFVEIGTGAVSWGLALFHWYLVVQGATTYTFIQTQRASQSLGYGYSSKVVGQRIKMAALTGIQQVEDVVDDVNELAPPALSAPSCDNIRSFWCADVPRQLRVCPRSAKTIQQSDHRAHHDDDDIDVDSIEMADLLINVAT